MDIVESIILGITQGLTEFIPVSSSGHLIVISNFFGPSPTTHLLVQSLDIGTVIALIIFFRDKIVDLCRQIFIKHDYRLARNIIITCIPVCTIGLLLSKLIETTDFFTSSIVIAVGLAVVGLIMLFLEQLPKLKSIKDGSRLSWWQALIIGIAQCIALIPGTSRSGTTIIASRIMGLKPKQAAEYSFLVSIPVMLGLIAKLFISDSAYMIANWQIVLIGNIFAFIFGMIAIKYLLNYLAKHSLKVFGVYRIVLALIVVILLASGILVH